MAQLSKILISTIFLPFFVCKVFGMDVNTLKDKKKSAIEKLIYLKEKKEEINRQKHIAHERIKYYGRIVKPTITKDEVFRNYKSFKQQSRQKRERTYSLYKKNELTFDCLVNEYEDQMTAIQQILNNGFFKNNQHHLRKYQNLLLDLGTTITKELLKLKRYEDAQEALETIDTIQSDWHQNYADRRRLLTIPYLVKYVGTQLTLTYEKEA